MARTVIPFVHILSVVVAAIAVWNIQFGAPPVGQVVIGAISLVLAFTCAIALEFNIVLQRAAVVLLAIVGTLMVFPVGAALFVGSSVSTLQAVVAALGALMLVANWMMLPR